jgi:hypothetical protein
MWICNKLNTKRCNGYTHPRVDVNQLSSWLDELLARPERADHMCQKSREIISAWNYDGGVQGILEASG